MKLVTPAVGTRFGLWTVVAPRVRATMQCRCACGVERPVRVRALLAGRSSGCGCVPSQLRHGHATTENGKRSRTYKTWVSMIQRCHTPTNDSYRHYGARGIRVCAAWRGSFDAFVADMGERPPARTLDRIDNNGNYEPSNCRWATASEQARNRRRPARAA